MRVIHINDCAGVACLLAVGQSNDGHSSMVRALSRYDPYDQIRYYGNATISHGPFGRSAPVTVLHKSHKSFWLYCLLDVMRADVIHIHDVPPAAHRFRHWRRKIIYHHHGSNSRRPFDSRTYERYAAQIILSTPDLQAHQYHGDAVYVPNPVDTELFAPRPIPDSNRGIVIMKPRQTESQTRQIIAEMGWDDIEWDIYGRGPGDMRFPYNTMPELLGRYSCYGNVTVNEKGHVDTTTPSTTTLQALSLGLRVYTADGILSGLPDQHRPEAACQRVLEIYQTVLEGGSVS